MRIKKEEIIPIWEEKKAFKKRNAISKIRWVPL